MTMKSEMGHGISVLDFAVSWSTSSPPCVLLDGDIPRLRDHGGVSSLPVTKNTGSEKPGGLLSNTTVFVM